MFPSVYHFHSAAPVPSACCIIKPPVALLIGGENGGLIYFPYPYEICKHFWHICFDIRNYVHNCPHVFGLLSAVSKTITRRNQKERRFYRSVHHVWQPALSLIACRTLLPLVLYMYVQQHIWRGVKAVFLLRTKA